MLRPLLASIVLASFVGGDVSAVSPARSTAIDVVRATLPNGLRIVVLRDTLAPVVSTWLNVRAGSDDEAFEGLAHAQEHMFFRGSRTLSGAQADTIAGFTGDEDNADTQGPITQYFHTMAAPNLPVAIALDASRFAGILDAPNDWHQERGAIEQEVTRNNSDAAFRLGVKIQHHLMAGTPYADDGLGTLASFEKQIDAPQLRAYYRTWYRPNNAVYVIAGDVDPQVAIATVRRAFGAMPAHALPPRAAVRLASPIPARFTDVGDGPTTTAMVAYRLPGLASPDYAASVVLADVLNNPRGDLVALAAAGKALAIEADPNQFPQAGFLTIVSHVGASTKPANALADIAGAVARLRARGVANDLVEAAKRKEAAQIDVASSSIRGLAQLWSQTIASEDRTPEDDLAAIRAVRPADVDRLVRTYLVAATATTAYAVPKAATAASGAASGASASGESPKAAAASAVVLPPWARTALETVRAPRETVAPSDFTLRNGLRVVVVPEHTSHAVVVRAAIRHEAGLEEPAGRAGVGDVVEALFPFGTQHFSRIGYQAQLDAIAATVQTGFAFSLDTVASHFDRGMQLLADDELHPAFAPADFAIVKQQRVDALTGEATSPDHLAAVATAQRLYPDGDPARHFASASEVARLRLADVTAYHRKAFRPDLATIVIVGDVTPARARASVERWFGGWSRRGAPPAVAPRAVADNVAANATIPATGRIQDTVRLRETLPLVSSDADIAPLLVGNAVLSGDFSSLLIRDMRVTTGYVYSVGSALAIGPTRSTFDVVYACAPENFSKAERALERDLRQMQTQPLASDRLQRAKARLVSSAALAFGSYDGLATSLLSDATLGLPLDADRRRARAELAATPNDVRVAMARWIRPAGFVRVVEGPQPR